MATCKYSLGLKRDEQLSMMAEPMKVASNKLSPMKLVGFFMITIGNAVGFGNIWRFPKLVQQYGGLSFVLVYLICSLIFAYPALLMEFLCGQLSQGTPFDAGYITGIAGAASAGAAFWSVCGLLSYYPLLVSYAIHYMVKSFGQGWYPEKEFFTFCEASSLTFCEGLNVPGSDHATCTIANSACTVDIVAYSNWYFENVQKYTGDLDGTITKINWQLYGCYFATTFLMFMAVVWGKLILEQYIMPVVMPIPGFLLLALVIFSLTLDGAGEGMTAYLGKFDVSSLYDVQVWTIAVNQVVFSCSIGSYTMLTLSADRRVDQPVGTDAIIVVIFDTVFALLAGIVIYCFMGYLANLTGISVDEASGSGGQAQLFVVFSAAVSAFNKGGIGSGFFGLLWWFTVFVLGWATAMCYMEVLVDTLCKATFSIKMLGARGIGVDKAKQIYACIICCGMLLSGLLNCSDQGGYVLDTMDSYVGNYLLPVNATLVLLLWCFFTNLEWMNKKMGVVANYSGIAVIFISPIISGTTQFFTDNKSTNAIFFVIFSTLIPLIAVFVISGLAMQYNQESYAYNLDLVWQGYQGKIILKNQEALINYHRPRFIKGACWPWVAGVQRWLLTPFLFSICCNTYFNGQNYYFRKDGDSYPFWVTAVCFTIFAVQWITQIGAFIMPDWINMLVRPCAIDELLLETEKPLFGLKEFIDDAAAAAKEEGAHLEDTSSNFSEGHGAA